MGKKKTGKIWKISCRLLLLEEKIVFYLLFNKLGYLFTVGGYYFDGVDTGCEVCYFDSLNIVFYAFYTSSRKREDVYALYFFAFHRLCETAAGETWRGNTY
jgi:hypothetical protein